ncbi:hypothetical protein [Marinobacter sp. MBR-105]
MAKRDLKGKLEAFDSDQLRKWLAWILSINTGAVSAVFIFYFINFDGGLSSDHTRWGTFGDFVGGILSPILSFSALIALLLTIVLQSRQLEISKNELEATRQELARSAAAQEKAEKAQLKQAKAQEIAARIAAINQLLQLEDEVIRQISSWKPGSPEMARRNNAMGNKRGLIGELQNLYQQLGTMSDEP